MARLHWQNLEALPLVHGRMAFALEVRRRLLEQRWDAIAVELPDSYRAAVERGLDNLPRIGAVFAGDRPTFLDAADAFIGYVPIDPGDGLIEALRIAAGERIPVHYVDAEIDEPDPRPLILPDSHALLGTGLDAWYAAVLPHLLRMRRPTAIDARREAHMAARLRDLCSSLGPEARILFLCGIGHWEAIRGHLDADTGVLDPDPSPPAWARYEPLHARSLPHVLGEMPRLVQGYEFHRSGFDLEPYDPATSVRELVLEARDLHARRFPDSMERTSIERLQQLLAYARKLTVCAGRLLPDAYTIGVAAKGVVGNDFAIAILAAAHRYRPNESPRGDQESAPEPDVLSAAESDFDADREGLIMTEDVAELDDAQRAITNRIPGEAREMKALPLRRPPDRRDASKWRHGWNPYDHCSWPPEDVVIENFRDYVTKRALTMAGLAQVKTEPFTTSFKDGLALRETLRDWHQRKIHVKEEPRVAGQVGALVIIFEEDDFGLRFPWRSTWHAEHEDESTLAFYSTNPLEDMIGPGIGRMHYGGCLFLYPPFYIQDVWEDMRFERARSPSERLLLSAIFHARERFVVHVGANPPSREMLAEAERFHRHLVHLPLDSFGTNTLERLRRAHVLNGRKVRGWAGRFID